MSISCGSRLKPTWEPLSSRCLMVFMTAHEDTFKVMMDCCFFLLSPVVLAVTAAENGYSLWRAVCQRYLCTTQLMVSNTIRKRPIKSTNSLLTRLTYKLQTMPGATCYVMKLMERTLECIKPSSKRKTAALNDVKHKSGLFNTFTTYFHMCCCRLSVSMVFTYTVENKHLEKNVK